MRSHLELDTNMEKEINPQGVIIAVFFIISPIYGVMGYSLQEISIERSLSSSLNTLGFRAPSLTLNSLSDMAKLGLHSSFRYVNNKAMKSAKGIKRIRLIQTYMGYDVFGTSVEAEVDANEYFSGQMYGQVAKNLNRYIHNPEACQQNVKTLHQAAFTMERLEATGPKIRKKDARRIIFADPTKPFAKLAYRIEFQYANGRFSTRPVYFFDACTGSVLLSYNQMQNRTVSATRLYTPKRDSKPPINLRTSVKFVDSQGQASCPVSANGDGGNEKIGLISYNSPPFCLNVNRVLTFCSMEGTYSRVIDNEESEREDKETVVRFLCFSGYNDAVNGAFGVANDALYYGEITGRFFVEKYGFRALDYKPRLVVHFGSEYENAFWDGTDMFFGDGGSTFHPFTDIDTVAHELAHGLIDKTSGLIYFGMSGGINEAFADITGEATKFFSRNSNDWLISYDIVKSTAEIEAIRFFEDPRRDGRSIKYAWSFRPFMDVHYSSGVFNHAFYALVALEEMDIYDAYKCFLDANLNLWGPFTNFFSGACNVMQAAYDNGFDHRKVRRAFRRVGIPLIFCFYAALTTSMRAGETRQNILVRATRSPIIKIDIDRRLFGLTTVDITADDNTDIHISVGRDNEASRVIVNGINSVRFSNSRSHVYVKLSSSSTSDVTVNMKVS